MQIDVSWRNGRSLQPRVSHRLHRFIILNTKLLVERETLDLSEDKLRLMRQRITLGSREWGPQWQVYIFAIHFPYSLLCWVDSNSFKLVLKSFERAKAEPGSRARSDEGSPEAVATTNIPQREEKTSSPQQSKQQRLKPRKGGRMRTLIGFSHGLFCNGTMAAWWQWGSFIWIWLSLSKPPPALGMSTPAAPVAGPCPSDTHYPALFAPRSSLPPPPVPKVNFHRLRNLASNSIWIVCEVLRAHVFLLLLLRHFLWLLLLYTPLLLIPVNQLLEWTHQQLPLLVPLTSFLESPLSCPPPPAVEMNRPAAPVSGDWWRRWIPSPARLILSPRKGTFGHSNECIGTEPRIGLQLGSYIDNRCN